MTNVSRFTPNIKLLLSGQGRLRQWAWSLIVVLAGSWVANAQEPRYFAIEVLDDATGRGVPLVELETTSHLRFLTDSKGLAAIDEPDLWGQSVYFSVRSHGYEFPADRFGFRGKALKVERGAKATLKLKRTNLAERLYRATGGGIYRDTLLLGEKAPLAQPVLNAGVFGCDSVMAAVYRGKVHWFWGDTTLPKYPLGNFHITGATSRLPKDGGLAPGVGVDFDYFVGKDKQVRAMAEMPGEGPTWIGGLTVLRDGNGRERMYANYVKIRNPLEPYRWGFVVWNDEAERFEKVVSLDKKPALFVEPQAHTFLRKEPNGTEYVYFTNPFPLARVKSQAGAFADPDQYEGYTCLAAGTRPEEKRLDRDAEGRLRYGWKRATPALTQKEHGAFVKAGLMKEGEGLIAIRDVETGRAVQAHYGSVYWNEYRKRWILIAVEVNGKSSNLGNVWFAEAGTPTGPWVYARQIVSHDKYSFYNPKQHPFLDEEGGRTIYFEGTYTQTFSGNLEPTPRYDYNQIMYRLDLSAPALNLPVPYYQAGGGLPSATKGADGRVTFFALERSGAKTVPVYQSEKGLKVGKVPGEGGTALFYALPSDVKGPPVATVPLNEFVHEKSGARAYSTEREWSKAGYARTAEPVCLVWKAVVIGE